MCLCVSVLQGHVKVVLTYLIREVDRCEWSASLSGRFIPKEIALGPFFMGGGGWMSPKSGLNHDSQKVTTLGSAWCQIMILHFVNRSLVELQTDPRSF
jgi:hypothetical protein